MKKNSKAAIMLRELTTGYKVKDRYRELYDTYNYKRRNVELRQNSDRELMHAQDQVSICYDWLYSLSTSAALSD